MADMVEQKTKNERRQYMYLFMRDLFIDEGYCTSRNEGLPTNNFRIWHSGHGGILKNFKVVAI